MELEIYQVAILLTTLFSGSDTRLAASRQTSVIRLQSAENQRGLQPQNLQEYTSSRQGMFYAGSPVVENSVHKSSILRRAVIQKLKRTGNLRVEFFFPSKTGRVLSKKTKATWKKLHYMAKFNWRNATANVVRNGKLRRRRYALQGSQWAVGSSGEITWNIVQWSAKLSNNDVERTLTEAFRKWAEVSPLVFREVASSATADITVKFVTGFHGDVKPFDGPGGVQAHAFYPSSGGDIHFDDDETWTVNSLLPIAVHEIGHSLGLNHSTVPGSIMTPFTSNLQSNVVLSDDDVDGIRHIYGFCRPRVTAIESWMGNGRSYIFKGDRFWRFNDLAAEADRGYPKAISWVWINVPDDIDEVFVWGHNWNTYFFKGHQYYRYNDYLDKVEIQYYPKNISDGWRGLPKDGIDAGFTWSNSKSYFFKGDKVYLYDNINDEVAYDYINGKLISDVWPGIPNNIDSAFRWYWDGISYFFKGDSYWFWDDDTDTAKGPFLIGDTEWKNICDV